MAEGGETRTKDHDSSTQTVLESETKEASVVLKLKKPAPPDKKVKWTQETVDNEHMDKKKSKCCCIYERPRLFGESSDEESDNDDCTGHCRGHKKKCFKPPDDAADDHNGGTGPGHGEESTVAR